MNDTAPSPVALPAENHTVLDTERVRLWGYDEQMSSSVRALLFGELVKRAQGVTEHYQSDLYHDAMFVSALDHAGEFFFVAREWGTDIGATAIVLLESKSLHSEGNVYYRVELTCENGGEWFVTFHRFRPYWLPEGER